MLAMRPIFQYSSSLHYQTRIATWPYGYHMVATDLNDPTKYEIVEHPPLHETFGIFTLTSPPEEEKEVTYVGSIVKSSECSVDIPLNLSVIHNTIPGETILSFEFDDTVSSDVAPIVETQYLPNDIRPLTKRRMTAAQCQLEQPVQAKRSNITVARPMEPLLFQPPNTISSAFKPIEISSALDSAIENSQQRILQAQQIAADTPQNQTFTAVEPTPDLVAPILGGPSSADDICSLVNNTINPAIDATRTAFDDIQYQQDQQRQVEQQRLEAQQRQLEQDQQQEQQRRFQEQQQRQIQQPILEDLDENDVVMKSDIQTSGNANDSLPYQTLDVEPNYPTFEPERSSTLVFPEGWIIPMSAGNLQVTARDLEYQIQDYSVVENGDVEWLYFVMKNDMSKSQQKYQGFQNKTGFFAYPADMFIIFLLALNKLFNYGTVNHIFIASLAYPEVGQLISPPNLTTAITVSKVFTDDLAVVFNKLFSLNINRSSDPQARLSITPNDYRYYYELSQTPGTQDSRGKLRTDLMTLTSPVTNHLVSFIVEDKTLIQVDTGALRGGETQIRNKTADYEVNFGPYPIADTIKHQQNKYYNLRLKKGTSYNEVDMYKSSKFLYD